MDHEGGVGILKKKELCEKVVEVIYQTREAVFHKFLNTEKRVENTTRSEATQNWSG